MMTPTRWIWPDRKRLPPEWGSLAEFTEATRLMRVAGPGITLPLSSREHGPTVSEPRDKKVVLRRRPPLRCAQDLEPDPNATDDALGRPHDQQFVVEGSFDARLAEQVTHRDEKLPVG